MTRFIFGGVAARLQNLRICFVHGGGAFPFTLGRIEHGYKVRPDLCAVNTAASPREQLGRFWVDSLVHDSRALQMFVDVMGTQRICLGSDYPFPLGEADPGRLIETLPGLATDDRDQLLAGSALEFLGLERSAFAGAATMRS